MPVSLSPDLDHPATVAVTGTVDLRAAIDIVDLADLLIPGAVIVRLESGIRLTADALTYLARHLRGRDVWFELTAPALHVRFLLALVGIPTTIRRSTPTPAPQRSGRERPAFASTLQGRHHRLRPDRRPARRPARR